MFGGFLTKLRVIAALTLVGCPTFIFSPVAAVAQGAASDSATDAQSVRLDAVTATPNRQTPVPQENAIATAPGLEQQPPSLTVS
jgi:hypothetical protein